MVKWKMYFGFASAGSIYKNCFDIFMCVMLVNRKKVRENYIHDVQVWA
jgi:hypothetical protein